MLSHLEKEIVGVARYSHFDFSWFFLFFFFFFFEKLAGRSLSPSFFPDRGEMPKNPKFLLFY